MNVASRHRYGWSGRLSLDPRRPMPFDSAENFWRATAQAATIVMCIIALGVLLYLARALILPVLCAFTVGMTLGPAIAATSSRRIPTWLIAIATVVFFVALINLAILLLAGPASELMARAPEFGRALADKLHVFDRVLAALSQFQQTLGILPSRNGLHFDPAQAAGALLTTITPAALQLALGLVLFFATLFFFILARSGFRRHTVNFFATREGRLRALKILNDIEENLGGYLIVVSTINLALGVATTLLAYVLGLPTPILWGAMAFVLNYVPYVGPAIMDLLLFAIGILTFPTLLGALLPPALFLGITTLEGQIITPAIVGRRVLSLPPLAIFLSIAFWTWFWGPVGALLATPILIVGRIVLAHIYPRQGAALPE
jgi:predicted PurR-regulated permease PerM